MALLSMLMYWLDEMGDRQSFIKHLGWATVASCCQNVALLCCSVKVTRFANGGRSEIQRIQTEAFPESKPSWQFENYTVKAATGWNRWIWFETYGVRSLWLSEIRCQHCDISDRHVVGFSSMLDPASNPTWHIVFAALDTFTTMTSSILPWTRFLRS